MFLACSSCWAAFNLKGVTLFTRKNVLTASVVGFFSWLLFWWNIDTPLKLNFDENHYIPAAKALLEGLRNQNWEHPPFGKYLIGIGLALFGDQPAGWRFASTVFGALTVSAFYLWSLALFQEVRQAALSTLFCVTGFFVFVQARIAMLDTSMVFFLIAALIPFTLVIREREDELRPLRWMGVFFGLALAVKWFTLFVWGPIALIVLWNRVFFRAPRARRDDPPLRQRLMFENVRIGSLVLWLCVVPLVVYYATFAPLAFLQENPLSFWKAIGFQKEMFDGQLRVVSPHPYASFWWQWPTLQRPIWYAFDKEGLDEVRAVVLLGNPLQMWLGLLAIAYCVWDWLKRRSTTAFVIVLCYVLFYGTWILIPRKVAFYYYYYPASLALALALTHLLSRMPARSRTFFELSAAVVSAALFAYFYPVLSGVPFPLANYLKWMWFRSWI